jgi:hypothetical protein
MIKAKSIKEQKQSIKKEKRNQANRNTTQAIQMQSNQLNQSNKQTTSKRFTTQDNNEAATIHNNIIFHQHPSTQLNQKSKYHQIRTSHKQQQQPTQSTN